MFENTWIALEETFLGMNEQKFALRSFSFKKDSAIRAKVINLGLKLENESLVLLIAIAVDSEQKLKILVQLHPNNRVTYLPSNLKLKLLSNSGDSIQDVTSGSHDNYMQLKRFRCFFGEEFNIEISNGDMVINETFVVRIQV